MASRWRSQHLTLHGPDDSTSDGIKPSAWTAFNSGSASRAAVARSRQLGRFPMRAPESKCTSEIAYTSLFCREFSVAIWRHLFALCPHDTNKCRQIATLNSQQNNEVWGVSNVYFDYAARIGKGSYRRLRAPAVLDGNPELNAVQAAGLMPSDAEPPGPGSRQVLA